MTVSPAENNVRDVALCVLPDMCSHPGLGPLSEKLFGVFSTGDASSSLRVRQWLASAPWTRGETTPFHTQELSHELAPYMDPLLNQAPGAHRTRREWRFIRTAPLKSPELVAKSGADAFASLLLDMHRGLSGDAEGFRTRGIQSTPDARGASVHYPASSLIEARLVEIYDYWASHLGTHPGLAAVVAMTALMNLHPFADGNGRVARVLFHWTLGLPGHDRPYLPIHELSLMSGCGYLVRLRQAQYFAEWEPLFGYLLMCVTRLFGPAG